MSSSGSDQSEFDCNTPPDIVNAATMATNTLLPEKSRLKYEKAYNDFLDWRMDKRTTSMSENVLLAYFDDLSKKFKSATLWTIYSMVKSTLNLKHQVDISRYSKLTAFLKRKAQGYEAKKSKTFSPEEINRFLNEAPDDLYLQSKVALIFGVVGACRRHELYNLQYSDVQIFDETILVTVRRAKTKVDRTFTVTGSYCDLCNKYMRLRPKNCPTSNFFLNYYKGKCTSQCIGLNKFGTLGKSIAKYLNLPDPELYTGHCFRRTSETVNMSNQPTALETPDPSKIIYIKPKDSKEPTKTSVDPLDTRSQRCRFCFRFSEDCIPISPHYLSADATTLAFNNVEVKLNFTDNFPNVVCKYCDFKLQIMYDFVKDVKAAQEALVEVENRKDLGLEMVVVKTEFDDENYSNDEVEDYDNDADGDDINNEDVDNDNDTKDGILNSVTVGETTFTKQVKKRKNTASPVKAKKTKVADVNYEEFEIDIKEEDIKKNYTNYNDNDNTSVHTEMSIMDSVPSEADLYDTRTATVDNEAEFTNASHELKSEGSSFESLNT